MPFTIQLEPSAEGGIFFRWGNRRRCEGVRDSESMHQATVPTIRIRPVVFIDVLSGSYPGCSFEQNEDVRHL